MLVTVWLLSSRKYKLSDVPFTALNRSFIDNYDLYLRTERRFALGTIVLLVTRLNTIVGEAIAEGIITADPFAGYEAEHPEREQKYLTAAELQRLMTTPCTTRNSTISATCSSSPATRVSLTGTCAA